MKAVEFFVYDWSYQDKWNYQEKSSKIQIYLYGLTKNNQNVAITVTGFQLHCYIEVPQSFTDQEKRELIKTIKKFEPVSVTIEDKKKLFYFHKKRKQDTYEDVLFPYIKVSFTSNKKLANFVEELPEKYNGIKIYEARAKPDLKF